MSVVPFELRPGSRVLICGAGGGWDFVCGLPIALELEARGHRAHLLSYSFTDLDAIEGASWQGDPRRVLEVSAACRLREGGGDYFPEALLARWLADQGLERPIWCVPRAGVVPTREAYDLLIDALGIDAVVCVDGGVDGIFRGDEHDLGTPSMDAISVIATADCAAARKIYATTAFGVEGAEGEVSHGQVLERMADLVREQAALGVGSILGQSSVGRRFVEAVEWMFDELPPLRRSVIVASLLSSIYGDFGRTVVHEKTEQSPPWISPLTSLVFYFDAAAVADLKLYRAEAATSQTVQEVADAIDRAREAAGVKPPIRIPI